MRAMNYLVLAGMLAFGMPASACAQDAKKVHAGIEVGGRGVKCTVLEVGGDGLYRRLLARTTNVTLSVLDTKGGFRQAAIDDTVKAIAAFQKTCRDTFKVPDDRIHIVGSSGVPAARNRADFVAAVKKATGKEMTFIDDKTEVALTFLGVIPKTERAEAITLDIGGGNTKGGYIANDRALVYTAIPLGSVTFTQKVHTAVKANKAETFASAAAGLREAKLVKPLRAGASAMPDLKSRKRVYLSGGMLWAMTSIVHPEAVDDAYITFTTKDIDAFARIVGKTPGKFPRVDLDKISDPSRRARAEAQLKSVAKAYQGDNLVAGAEILRALGTAFDLGEKTLIFPRNGAFGWLTAFIAGEKVP